ncbi:MAG TPA: inositol oxygenase family protein [Bryobacteraceae bacterium]|nr:inositol oxygenase family protein [Bryobacteraceae bacterium]
MDGPLEHLEQWDDFVSSRYDPAKKTEAFRDYENSTPGVREFYRLNHTLQTRDFVLQKKREYLGLNRMQMSVWEALDYLNTLVDDSDPDTDLSQIEHNLQTAEAIRRDGHPRWFVLTGLIHDLGKILCLKGEPQWAVVGDTFPTGCAYSDKVVFSNYFRDNPDYANPSYQTRLGIYDEHCGLDKVDLSWGHDEYMYHVAKPYLPEAGLYMIRYHSFYAAHREGAYEYLMSDHDKEMFQWVRAFNPYDLYSKSADRPKLSELKGYYAELVNEYFPSKLNF